MELVPNLITNPHASLTVLYNALGNQKAFEFQFNYINPFTIKKLALLLNFQIQESNRFVSSATRKRFEKPVSGFLHSVSANGIAGPSIRRKSMLRYFPRQSLQSLVQSEAVWCDDPQPHRIKGCDSEFIGGGAGEFGSGAPTTASRR
ncbi:hypothetical protein Pyn_17576 [Prunus yedoensis var. nudiflora]|uniref:Uncharacterized protein n=1 Tax=Prunus yedoensis var. nudiflora TaxID=2094558 RepID=A0A314UFI7_PRUYE|nr:hypothetical protein Pyn_17576 [Prunus yedoensis var. nudiflora]